MIWGAPPTKQSLKVAFTSNVKFPGQPAIKGAKKVITFRDTGTLKSLISLFGEIVGFNPCVVAQWEKLIPAFCRGC